MPSSVAHGLTALALGTALLPERAPRRLLYTGVAAAVLIDIDAIGRPFGFGDLTWLGGHRALTHSVVFAAAVGAVLTAFWRRSQSTRAEQLRVYGFFVMAMVAHGALYAFTRYGEGIAFLAPLSWQRFDAPWAPLQGLWEEVFMVWLPAWVFIHHVARRRARRLALEAHGGDGRGS